ncbi:MAG: hypothetical protein M3430_21525 [Acidobacteriota bacterium]|nr:hypothetical protein [Acidobacteriota bacterium]
MMAVTLERKTGRGGGARTLLTACVLLALCFSVGEGVRLIPFPHSQTGAAAHEVGAPSVGQADINSFQSYRPGRLDMPVKVQKRSKRQTDPCGLTPKVGAVGFATTTLHSAPARVADHYSHSPAALSQGRAPPLAS